MLNFDTPVLEANRPLGIYSLVKNWIIIIQLDYHSWFL